MSYEGEEHMPLRVSHVFVTVLPTHACRGFDADTSKLKPELKPKLNLNSCAPMHAGVWTL